MLFRRLSVMATLVMVLSGCSGDDAIDRGLKVSDGVHVGFQATEVLSLAIDVLCITGEDPAELVSVEAISAGQNLTVTDFEVVSVPDDSFANQSKPLDETGWVSLDERVTARCGDDIQALGLEMTKTTSVGRAESMRFSYRINGKEQTQTVPFDVTMCSRLKNC